MSHKPVQLLEEKILSAVKVQIMMFENEISFCRYITRPLIMPVNIYRVARNDKKNVYIYVSEMLKSCYWINENERRAMLLEKRNTVVM